MTPDELKEARLMADAYKTRQDGFIGVLARAFKELDAECKHKDMALYNLRIAFSQYAEAASVENEQSRAELEDSQRNRKLGLAQIDFWEEKARAAEAQLYDLQQLYGAACIRLQELGEKTVQLRAPVASEVEELIERLDQVGKHYGGDMDILCSDCVAMLRQLARAQKGQP